MLEYIIDEEYSGVRVDRFLRKKLKNIFLSDIYKMIRKGQIKVNNKKIKKDTRLNLGDILQLYLKKEFELEEKKEENFIFLSENRIKQLNEMIVFEDENLFIINKEAGAVIHKGSGHNLSLLEEYRAYFQNNIVNFVNRIDKDTAGLVIGAKNIKTARKLAEYIRDKKVEKKYYILVHGYIPEENFKIETYLRKEEENVMVSEIEIEGYKKSITYFKKILSSEKYTLLEANLKTGRTHQLRVQLAHINHSIVGDKKYGLNDKENMMYLFSYFLNIPEEKININLDIPKTYINKLKN